jgi:hypothetical protein
MAHVGQSGLLDSAGSGWVARRRLGLDWQLCVCVCVCVCVLCGSAVLALVGSGGSRGGAEGEQRLGQQLASGMAMRVRFVSCVPVPCHPTALALCRKAK